MTLTKMPSILIRQNDGQFSHSIEIIPLKRPRYSEIRTQNIVFCWQYCQRRCSTNHTKSSFPWEIESPASGKKWTVGAKCVNKTNIETLFEMIQILENLNLTKGTLIQCIWGFTFSALCCEVIRHVHYKNKIMTCYSDSKSTQKSAWAQAVNFCRLFAPLKCWIIHQTHICIE